MAWQQFGANLSQSCNSITTVENKLYWFSFKLWNAKGVAMLTNGSYEGSSAPIRNLRFVIDGQSEDCYDPTVSMAAP